MPSASQRPNGSSCARVTPQLARGELRAGSCCFCAALPPSSERHAAERSTVEKNGPGSTTRPISSSTTTMSTKLRPAPPYSSGRMSPSPAELGHLPPEVVGEAALVLHHLADVGHRRFLGEEVARRRLRSISCSSLNPKSIPRVLSAVAEHGDAADRARATQVVGEADLGVLHLALAGLAAGAAGTTS